MTYAVLLRSNVSRRLVSAAACTKLLCVCVFRCCVCLYDEFLGGAEKCARQQTAAHNCAVMDGLLVLVLLVARSPVVAAGCITCPNTSAIALSAQQCFCAGVPFVLTQFWLVFVLRIWFGLLLRSVSWLICACVFVCVRIGWENIVWDPLSDKVRGGCGVGWERARMFCMCHAYMNNTHAMHFNHD